MTNGAWQRRFVVGAAAGAAALAAPLGAYANVALTSVAADSFTNTTSQHKTIVEPDTFAFGSTVVMAAQSGRFSDGGASGIAWATSTDNGTSWGHHGVLPGVTNLNGNGGPYDRVSDPSVAYDARHNVWLIASLAIDARPSVQGVAVIVSRSTDGGVTWGSPVTVATSSTNDLDKDWVVCDSTASSPYYGRCYVEFDDHGLGDLIEMSTSADGGSSWGGALSVSSGRGQLTGLGGQPVVQPNGTVVVPASDAYETSIIAFTSTNGGSSWGAANTVASVVDHTVAAGLRSGPLPSAELDGAGKVFVVWEDCRFEQACGANDIVLSTSSNGTSWTSPVRVPIDSVGSGVDHFLPSVAVDPTTAGSTAHLVVTYYDYTDAKCRTSTCQLNVGYLSSVDGGAQWSAATQIAGPMSVKWLASTTQGNMVGDYFSTSFAGGVAVPAVVSATQPSGGRKSSTLDEALFTTGGLTPTGGSAPAVAGVVVSNRADHPLMGRGKVQ